MPERLRHLQEKLRLQLWIAPLSAALVAAVAAVVVAWMEASGWLADPFEIDPAGAQGVLGAISTAMISFTALVFSVTMLLLQLASTQLSPRVTRTFLRDRFNHAVLGLFVATFVFSLIILLTVSRDDASSLGVVIALLLVLAAVVAFVLYIDHIANAIRASSVIDSIASETSAIIEARYGDAEEGPGTPAGGADAGTGDPASDDALPEVVTTVGSPHRGGHVVVIDEERLAEVASEAGIVIELLVAPGDFVVHGAPLMALRGGRVDPDAVAGAVKVSPERSMNQDPLFGFRQLVDIALRMVSPSTSDPATAISAIDRIHGLLDQLMPLTLDAPRIVRDDSAVRVVLLSPDWDAFVHAAVDEIADGSESYASVSAALISMLESLAAKASPERAAVLRGAIGRIEGPSRISDRA